MRIAVTILVLCVSVTQGATLFVTNSVATALAQAKDGDTLVLSGRPDTLALAEEKLLRG